MDAVELVEEMYGPEHEGGAFLIRDLTGDKGYHPPAELGIIQEAAGPSLVIPTRPAGSRQTLSPKPGRLWPTRSAP